MREHLDRIVARIETAARRSGREPGEVTLIGISKTVPSARVGEAISAGLTHLGENRVQEAAVKIPELAGMLGPAFERVTWHLVGHLQSNKARRAVELFSVIHSVDSFALADRLSRHAVELARPARVLIQVDLAGEATKHGAVPDGLADLASRVRALPGLTLRGLMTLPPLFENPEDSRPYFRRLRAIRDELASGGVDLPDLSMGMSNDFEHAIEFGATYVRIGSALFAGMELSPDMEGVDSPVG